MILDYLRALKLDEYVTEHEHVNKFMDLTESLSTLVEEMAPQISRNLLLNSMIDPDYENIRAMLKSTNKNAPLTEFLQGIREQEDCLERCSRKSRKLDKI